MVNAARLGEALAAFTIDPVMAPPWARSEVLAAARAWHTLTNPNGRLIEDAAEVLKPWIDVDPAVDPNEWHLAQMHNARRAVVALFDALTVTADE